MCRIDTIWREAPHFASRNIFEYDNTGRLISHTTYGSSGEVYVALLTYAGPSIVMRRSSGASSFVSRDSFVLNDAGFIVYRRLYSNDTATSWIATAYAYEAGHRLATAETVRSGTSSPYRVQNFVWEDGDITDVTSPTESSLRYEYYMDQHYRVGDGLDWEHRAHFNFPVLNNAHLVKTLIYGGVPWIGYSYTFDDAGRIHSMTSKSLTNPTDSFINRDTYSYRCW